MDAIAAAPADAHAEHVAALRGGSRSFFVASLVMPRRYAEPAAALYAYCRAADDAIDTGSDPIAALAGLHDRLDRIYAGTPAPIDADRAFAALVERFAIPRTLPAALLEGFEWDTRKRRYATIAELADYGARVAGTVGAMMAIVMGRRGEEAIARACDLGVAMQYTNIARDVGEDARADRLYLPLDWLDAAGIDAARFVADPRPSPALAAVVKRLLDEAERLYARAESGIALLPAAARPAIGAARQLYAEIGHELARAGLDPVTRRTIVPKPRLAAAILRGMRTAAFARPAPPSPPLAATAYLVRAVGALPALPTEVAGLEAGIARVVTLFHRLDEIDRARAPARVIRSA